MPNFGKKYLGINSLGKDSAKTQLIRLIISDIIFAYENRETPEQKRAKAERQRTIKRELEEIAKAEERTKTIAEIERLERELAQARATL